MPPEFCLTLNGKVAGFPESYEEMQAMLHSAQDYMTAKKYRYPLMGKSWYAAMITALSAYSMTKVPPKPGFGYPDNGIMDEVFDLTTDRVVKIDERVRNYSNKECCSFQVEEKVCKNMVAHQKESWEGGDGKIGFFSGKCSGAQGGLHAFCEFKQKVFVTLSGLCNKSPVDQVYSLMEPKSHPHEGDAWDDFYRFGTFSGMVESFN